jgi:hypothetical protein
MRGNSGGRATGGAVPAYALVAFIMLGIISGPCAASGEVVTTTDGRTIELRDDGTFRVLPPTPREARRYEQIALQDVVLDGDKLNGRLVELRGFLMAFIDGISVSGLSLRETFSSIGVEISIRQDKLSREQKRAILEKCQLGCRAVIKGELVVKSSSQAEVVAHDHRLEPLGPIRGK